MTTPSLHKRIPHHFSPIETHTQQRHIIHSKTESHFSLHSRSYSITTHHSSNLKFHFMRYTVIKGWKCRLWPNQQPYPVSSYKTRMTNKEVIFLTLLNLEYLQVFKFTGNLVGADVSRASPIYRPSQAFLLFHLCCLTALSATTDSNIPPNL